MLSYKKLKILTYPVYVLVLFSGFFLSLQNILSYNHFFVWLFGAMGTYAIIDSMARVTTSSVLKTHQKLLTTTLVLTLVVLTFVFLISTIDSSISVITVAIIGIVAGSVIRIMDWTAKRQIKSDRTILTR